MHTEVNETGRFERTLTIQLEEAELEDAKSKAARKLSKQMKIKGFRPGKAPRSIVERMVGADELRSEAIDEAIPATVGAAIDESGLDPATVPSVIAVRDRDEGGVEVDVLVTLWPTLDAIPDYEGTTIEIEPPVASEEEIEQQIDGLRNQFADLEDVDRAAQEGDFVTIDVGALADGVEVEQAAANDLLYEIGSHSFFPGLDEILVGAGVGDVVEGEGTLPKGFIGDEDVTVRLRALVKEVKAKVLPELTDEFVSDSTEFETVEELRSAIEENIASHKTNTARSELHDRAVAQLVEAVDLELPQALVDAEAEARIRNLLARLESDNIGFEDYLRIVGHDQVSFVEEIKEQSSSALATRVVIESLIAIEGLGVDDDELAEAYESIAGNSESSADEIEQMLKSSGQIESLVGDILRGKALRRIADGAVAVDADGNTIDLTPVAPEEETTTDDDITGDEDQDEDPSPEIEE